MNYISLSFEEAQGIKYTINKRFCRDSHKFVLSYIYKLQFINITYMHTPSSVLMVAFEFCKSSSTTQTTTAVDSCSSPSLIKQTYQQRIIQLEDKYTVHT